MYRVILTALSFLLLPTALFAHALGGQCKLKDGQVTVVAYYSTNEPAADARVIITDEQGQEIGRGRTDANGSWSFPKPGPGHYHVQIDAGAGHRVDLELKLGDDESVAEANGRSNPSRESFTSVRTVKILIGFVAIVILAFALWLIVHRPTSPRSPNQVR
jgi:hypothetical protein